jgi:hypothetical protein
MRSIQIEAAAPTDLPGALALLAACPLLHEGLIEGLDAALELYGEAAPIRLVAVAPALGGQDLGREPTRPCCRSCAVSPGSTRSRRPPRATSPP